MNRRRYLNYISTLNTLQDTNINFKRLIPTAVYNNSRPHNNKNLIGDININITLPSGFVAQNIEAPFDRSIRQEPISEVFEQQNIPDEAPITQDEPVILDTPESRNIIFEQERLRRRMERARILEERETRSIARRQRNAESENRRRAEIDPDNELISIPSIDSGDVRLGGSDSDSTGSNEFLLGIGYSETPTRPNTPSINPTSLQGVGLDSIQDRYYFDTTNF